MRQAVVLAACLLAVACASSGRPAQLQPDVKFVQLRGPADLNYPAGEIEVQYGMRISNPAAEPITLIRVRLEPFGSGGPYDVSRQMYDFNQQISPGEFRDVTFWAKAFASGDRYRIDARSPVGVKAVAYFDSPSGQFRKVVMANLTQTGREE